jgi:hypothetical protein
MGENADMADVSIYVAVISAAAGIVGATIPQAATAIRDGRRADRDRRERLADTRRQACVQLLRTVLDLRVHVANNQDYHGEEMAARLAAIRECAATAEVEAVSVALMVGPELAKAAEQLASAAARLATVAADNASLQLGASTQAPDFGELDDSVTAFKTLAVADGPG